MRNGSKSPRQEKFENLFTLMNGHRLIHLRVLFIAIKFFIHRIRLIEFSINVSADGHIHQIFSMNNHQIFMHIHQIESYTYTNLT